MKKSFRPKFSVLGGGTGAETVQQLYQNRTLN